MLSILTSKIYPHIRRILYEEVEQILRKKKTPSIEEWNQAVQSYQEQEKKWKETTKRELYVEKRATVAHILVERSTCAHCDRPHFQAGLCLYHFHLQYTQNAILGQENI